jgi:Asp-tRNA(Asn)/Glu-tRNA(Gln) amidotransferase C subunit
MSVEEDQVTAMQLATGKKKPKPVSVVNKVTEYGALFNSLNEKRIAAGMPQLTTAMEVLIEAIQPESELDIKDRAKIADKLASYESSRAPIISIEHVNNVTREDDATVEDSIEDFLQAIKKS